MFTKKPVHSWTQHKRGTAPWKHITCRLAGGADVNERLTHDTQNGAAAQAGRRGREAGRAGGRGHRPRQEVGRRFFLEEMRALGAVSTGHEGASTALHPEDLAIPGTPQGAVKR